VPEAPSIPDGTFSENLPFAVPPAQSGRAGDDALGLAADSSGNSGRAVLVPVAGGLLLCLVAFHVRRFNRSLVAPDGGKPGGKPARKPATPRRQVTQSLPIIATSETDHDPLPVAPQSVPAPAPNWLLGIGHKSSKDATPAATGESRPSGVVRPKPLPVSLEYWTARPETAPGPKPVSDDRPDDDSKWAPPTRSPFATKAPRAPVNEPPSEDAWEDILVKPGGGMSHPA
jgi:hypothetical protein